MEFVPYPKTPRLKRSVVITEKLDGTNAQVVISREPHRGNVEHGVAYQLIDADGRTMPADYPDATEYLVMRVGSRNRWITPGKDTDNYGFARWCQDNADELFKLGEGRHFGEWYGQGIGRGYGLTEKRFALFNTARWGAHNPETPKCVSVVPVFDWQEPDKVLEILRDHGSIAVPGFMKPEGIIVYHTASKQNYKVLLENDELPKGLVEA